MAARKVAFCGGHPFLSSSETFFPPANKPGPPGKCRVVSPFGPTADIKPTFWGAPAAFGYAVLKKASPERIKELLRVLNWIASPFGSQEYLLMYYGVKDVDYSLDDDGNPVLTMQGKADTTIPWQSIAKAPTVLYLPGNAEYAQVMQSAEKALLPVVQIDPTSSVYSETFATKGSVLEKMVSDRVGEMVLGRAPVSSIDQLISDWRAQGGGQMRAEFEQAVSAAISKRLSQRTKICLGGRQRLNCHLGQRRGSEQARKLPTHQTVRDAPLAVALDGSRCRLVIGIDEGHPPIRLEQQPARQSASPALFRLPLAAD